MKFVNMCSASHLLKICNTSKGPVVQKYCKIKEKPNLHEFAEEAKGNMSAFELTDMAKLGQSDGNEIAEAAARLRKYTKDTGLTQNAVKTEYNERLAQKKSEVNAIVAKRKTKVKALSKLQQERQKIDAEENEA